MNGSIWTTSTGIWTPTSCSAVVIDSDRPNSRPPMTDHQGRPRASIAMTMAMKPMPLVTNGTNVPAPTIAR